MNNTLNVMLNDIFAKVGYDKLEIFEDDDLTGYIITNLSENAKHISQIEINGNMQKVSNIYSRNGLVVFVND